MITLMLLLTSVWKVDGNTVEDWRDSAFKIHPFDYSIPTMINKLYLPEVCFVAEKKLAEELAAAQPAWILEYKDAAALPDLNNRVEHGGCKTWLNIHNDKDFPLHYSQTHHLRLDLCVYTSTQVKTPAQMEVYSSYKSSENVPEYNSTSGI